MSLLSISDILKFDKPDLLFVQEISNSSESLINLIKNLGYSAQCNVDSLHPSLPGTALVWKSTIKVSEINCLIERRVQSIKCGGETFVNVYAPSGSSNRRERWNMFNELFLHLLQIGGNKLPVLGGDFNAVLAECDTTRNFGSKYCKILDRIIKHMKYIDCFRYLHPRLREFTFHRGAQVAQSRLDRFYVPPHLLNDLITVRHKARISDHCQVEVKLNLTAGQVGTRPVKHKTFWKLNTSLLDDLSFREHFMILYERLSSLVLEYDNYALWWEDLAKPSIITLCKDFSFKLSKERKTTKRFLYSSLNIYLRRENWEEVARVKEAIRRMLVYDSRGVLIRSRQKEYAEEEKGSIYHYNKEMKAGSNNLTKMKYNDYQNEERITDNIDDIANITVNFYEALFNGRHDKDLNDTGVSFQPTEEYLEEFLAPLSTLSQRSQNLLVKEVTEKEVEEIVKNCPNGKSPGLDGLPYELYKHLWDIIGKDFTEVIKAQLIESKLIESGKHGATQLSSKVDGVPFVTELRPLTLLCCDYRILSKTINGRLHPVMKEVVDSSQLATGEKEKNILTGAYDLIATIDFVNKHKKQAYIASYDQVKAYDRASVQFLLKVMERMSFPKQFQDWIEMLHKEATTCLILPDGLSRKITVTFSFRQGDPIAMNCYTLTQEPLLRVVRINLTGITITNFKQLDESYCDDIEVVSDDTQDLIRFDQVMKKFEATSGAILSRNKKSKIMGLGVWQNRENWPEEVCWMRTEKQLRIFGFTFCDTYQGTLKETWERTVKGFEKVLFSWQARSLETMSQRVEVARTFALSKLYYVAQVLPLPAKYRVRIERSLSKFIFRGRHERLSLSLLENPPESGGLGVPNIAIKADSLLLKQTLRILSLPLENTFRHIGYWLGGFLRDTGCGLSFPELDQLGPVCHYHIAKFPLHKYMLENLEYGIMSGEVDIISMKTITTKSIYMARMEQILTSPKVEEKFPAVDFVELVYPRLNNPVLESKQRDLLFSLLHGIYRNRDRLFRQGRVDDPLCPNQDCNEQGLVQDIVHIFCGCSLVKNAWFWFKTKMTELMNTGGLIPVVSNDLFVMLMFPSCTRETDCCFLVGNYVEMVDKIAITKGTELSVGSLLGVLEGKKSALKMRSVPLVNV